MTHQCSFKCLLPWKQAAGIQVWYSDNGLSLSHRALYVTFGLPPPCCSTPLSGFHSIFPFFLFPALIFIHSHHSNPPPPRLFLLFIQSNVFTSRSFYSRQPCRDASHLSPLFFHRLPVCHIIFLTSFSSSTSAYSCFITFDSLCLHLLFLAMFSFLCCKLCLQLYSKALMLKQTQTHRQTRASQIYSL